MHFLFYIQNSVQVVQSTEESTLEWYTFWSTSASVASYMQVKYSGLIAMHEPYKSNDITCKITFGVKTGQAK